MASCVPNSHSYTSSTAKPSSSDKSSSTSANDAYQSISTRSQIQLKHPFVKFLHTVLVLQGNWDDADDDAPPECDGHAMRIDPENGHLFGEWDGHKSLDDFWVYDIRIERWRVITHNPALEKNDPITRSHPRWRLISSLTVCLLGRLGDEDVMLVMPEDEEALRRAGRRIECRRGGHGVLFRVFVLPISELERGQPDILLIVDLQCCSSNPACVVRNLCWNVSSTVLQHWDDNVWTAERVQIAYQWEHNRRSHHWHHTDKKPSFPVISPLWSLQGTLPAR